MICFMFSVSSFLSIHREKTIGALLCLGLGMLSGWFNTFDPAWYKQLVKPFFQPPSWLFAPVWTILYLMIGSFGGYLWQNRSTHPRLLQLFILQMILNLIWSFLFFGLKAIGLACFDLSLLWSLVALLIYGCHQKNLSYLSLIPYWIWLTYAFSLNLSLLYLN